MEAAQVVRTARRRAGLSLRALAARAGTSHSTLAAYEAGRKVPTVDTLDRLVRAAGVEAQVQLVPGLDHGADPTARGRELIEALELAAMFPARHSPQLEFPPFPRQPAPLPEPAEAAEPAAAAEVPSSPRRTGTRSGPARRRRPAAA